VALKKEIAKESGLKAVYEEKAFQVANLAALRKQMEDVEDKFTELKKQLPTEKEVPGLLDDITNLGTDSGLDIGSIKLTAESKKEFYIELPININVSGSYHQLGQFVSGIAGLPRIVTLHDYTIKPSGTTVSMQISAKTYRYDETK
jgi:type IV pilus assembly protein PilO